MPENGRRDLIRRLIVKKGLDQNLQLLPGYPSAIDLQITLMSTAHIMRTVLELFTLICC